MFKLIFSGAFLIFALMAALFGFLRSMRTKWQLSAVKIATTIISCVFAVFISCTISWHSSALLIPIIKNNLPSQYYDDIQTILSSTAVSESIQAIVSMIVAPVLFLLIFSILKPIVSLANKPCAKLLIKLTENTEDKTTVDTNEESPKNEDAHQSDFIYSLNNDYAYGYENQFGNLPVENTDGQVTECEPQKEKKITFKNKKITAASSLVGALSGFILFYITFIPFICSTSMVATTIPSAIPSIDQEYSSVVTELADAAKSNAGTVAMKLLGGEMVYNRLTTYKVNGHNASLANEVKFISTVSNAVINLSTSDSDTYDGKAVKQITDNIGNSFSKTTIIPSILPEVIAAANTKWDAGEEFLGIEKITSDGYLAPIYDTILEILSSETYDTIKTDICTILDIIGIIGEKNSVTTLANDPMILLADKETNTNIFKILYANERFYPIIPTIAECGIELISSSLNIRQNAQESYIDLIDEIMMSARNFDGNHEELAELICQALKTHGIDTEIDSCLPLANKLIRQNVNGTLTSDSVLLALSETEIKIIEADQDTETAVRLTLETYTKKTQLIFADNIQLNRELPSDIQAESTLLANAISTASTLASKLQNSDLSERSLIIDLGSLLDCFDRTNMFGSNLSGDLLICMLQSEKALEALDMDLISITHLAKEICNASQNDSYTLLLKNLVTTIDIIDLATKNEDITQNVEELIENLTPSTADTIKEIANPDIIQSYGVPAESAKKTSELVNNIFSGLSDAKQNNTLTEDQYSTESKAVSDMINIAMNAAKQDTSSGLFGEQSATGITAAEYIDRITDSQVISQTLMNTVYDQQGNMTLDPLQSSIYLTNNEKTELVNAMNAHLADTGDADKEDIQKMLIAAAAIINVDVILNADGTIILSNNNN